MMMKMLAQVQPVPWAHEAQWLWGLVGFIAILALSLSTAVSIKKLWGRVPPIEQQFASREQWQSHHERIGKIEEDLIEVRAAIYRSQATLTTALQEMERSLNSAGEKRAEKIHERIDHITERINHTKA